MNSIIDFLKTLDFSFGQGQDIRKKEIELAKSNELTKKLENNFFAYESPENTNTSFCVINVKDLSEDELFEIRKYLWNEDKYDFYFYSENSDSISLFYSKINPKKNKKSARIDSFKGLDEDEQKLDKIRKWNFDTGAFWLYYTDFLDKVKKAERVDKKLVEQLKDLKKELLSILGAHKTKEVQSLIDRTLFIKFLEDNHIINSYFYKRYFDDENVTFKDLLCKGNKANQINYLFELINTIFSNVLFKTPLLEETVIISASDAIYKTISGEVKGQLSLFDFQFNIIPIEFISHIYEVFLEEQQSDEGIYYTPPKLAQLIVDDVITRTGKVLDPACGSGMFLILALRKILRKNQPKKSLSVSEKIQHKTNVLKKYIFGIEKDYIAWRLVIFSLYLEILNDIHPEEIKKYIEQRIQSKDIRIFEDFSKNIINGNSLVVKKNDLHFANQSFNYIIGNPPYFEITKDDEEIEFIKKYQTEINGKVYTAEDVVGYKQISQAFMLKIKDWANKNTKFGFVLNSSNFYNEKSTEFRNFFFENYQIENFYELSRVKKILFKNAKESVIVATFNNQQVDNNLIKYYPVDLELFSETFKLLVIKEDKRIDIKQKDVFEKRIALRELLVGNKYDFILIEKLSINDKLDEYLLNDKNYDSFRGLERATNETVRSYFNIKKDVYNNFSNPEKTRLQEQFANEKYLSNKKTSYFNTPYVYNKSKIKAFRITEFDGYINNNDVTKDNFRRTKNSEIYLGKKILFNRFGDIVEAHFIDFDCYFSTYLYVVKLQNEKLYILFTAILNSNLVNYFLTKRYRMRIDANFENLDTTAIKNIPIPKELDKDLVSKISQISKKLTQGILKYEGRIKEKLNELIYDLYDLNFVERQRVKDFFEPNSIIKNGDMENYKETLFQTIGMYFENQPKIEYSLDNSFGFNLCVVAIYFNNKGEAITSKKVLEYEITTILQQTNTNFHVMKDTIFGKDCIYIIRDNQFKNWSKTKAFEDGKFILEKLSE